ADLDAGPRVGVVVLGEGGAGEHGDPADAVTAGLGAQEDHDVPDAAGLHGLEALARQHAHAERVDQRVALVAGVEEGLAADVGQAHAVAVVADALDDARQDPGGVGVVELAEAQRVHDGDRAGAHRDDVADDAADAGRGALLGLHERGMVVGLDLEGHREVLVDGDHAGVLADAGEQARGLRVLLAELPQVDLAGLVRAVLGPHDRVHGQLGLGGAAAEDLPDPGVLVLGQAELGVRLLLVGRGVGDADGVHDDVQLGVRRLAPSVRWARTEATTPSPSVDGPVSASTACSGWGMRPTTFPASLAMPAMSRIAPLGLSR